MYILNIIYFDNEHLNYELLSSFKTNYFETPNKCFTVRGNQRLTILQKG